MKQDKDDLFFPSKKGWFSYTVQNVKYNWATCVFIGKKSYKTFFSFLYIDLNKCTYVQKNFIKIINLKSSDNYIFFSNEEMRVTVIRKEKTHLLMFCIPQMQLIDGGKSLETSFILSSPIKKDENTELFRTVSGTIRLEDRIFHLKTKDSVGIYNLFKGNFKHESSCCFANSKLLSQKGECLCIKDFISAKSKEFSEL